MAETKRKRVCGKYCVAGAPNNISCTNNSETPGISMHNFPSDPKTRKLWTQFVRRHRKDFKPTEKPKTPSVLCSVHFAPECFNQRLDLVGVNSSDLAKSRRLVPGSFPTIDAVAQAETEPSSREKRKVSLLSTVVVKQCWVCVYERVFLVFRHIFNIVFVTSDPERCSKQKGTKHCSCD